MMEAVRKQRHHDVGVLHKIRQKIWAFYDIQKNRLNAGMFFCQGIGFILQPRGCVIVKLKVLFVSVG